jgi:hypothetical protein
MPAVPIQMENSRMSLPQSLGSYRDCQDLFEKATADPKGIRVCLSTYEACFQRRQRMHYFRNLDRRANAEMYPAGHPMHGTSAYDDFILQIIKDTTGLFWLYITPRSGQILHIEGLSEVPDLIDTDGTEVHLIEDQTDAN